MRIRNILTMMTSVLLLASCSSSKKVVYFQDLEPGQTEIPVAKEKEITVRPEDKITIIVNTRDPQLTNLFNLPVAHNSLGSSNTSSGSGQVTPYTVDALGEIDFPILGKLYVAGKTRSEIAEYVKSELVSKDLVKDPVVTVDFVNLFISVLGEVKEPGRHNIDRGKVTILDAISMAGDLTIQGNRKNVLVLREEKGVQKSYTVDLCSAESIYSSPVYYLQQNDVVYVEPNGKRSRESTINGNTVLSAPFWISLASFLTTIAVLIWK